MLAVNRSLLQMGYNLVNVREALASNLSMCNLIEDYTEILYIFNKSGAPSSHCKKALGRSPMMGEVDRPSLVFIDFDIPAFAPGHHRDYPALEFPNYIALLAVCRI
jgi:hypothetical protein